MMQKKISNLFQSQKNKINTIFIIHDWKYVIILIYHCNTLNNMNSNKNYNSENNSDYLSFVENSNCDSKNNSDKNDSISSSIQKTSKIVNVVINIEANMIIANTVWKKTSSQTTKLV